MIQTLLHRQLTGTSVGLNVFHLVVKVRAQYLLPLRRYIFEKQGRRDVIEPTLLVPEKQIYQRSNPLWMDPQSSVDGPGRASESSQL